MKPPFTTSIPHDVPLGPYFHTEHGRGTVIKRSALEYPDAKWRECVFQPDPKPGEYVKPQPGDLMVAWLAVFMCVGVLACLVILLINFLT